MAEGREESAGGLAPFGGEAAPLAPLQRLDGPSRRLGVELWVQRDDLTGFGLSGNKVRKLRVHFAEAAARGATAVITCGGIQSNHARATVFACRERGLRPVLLLRGAPPATAEGLDGNLLLDLLLGAEVHWIRPEDWPARAAVMESLAVRLREAGERPYLIPEGGSDARGAHGFVLAGRALADRDFDSVVVACGSGGTVAGLALAGLPVRGVPVCDDAAFFRARVAEIGREYAALTGIGLPEPGPGRWDLIDGFVGPGYARVAPEAWRPMLDFHAETGILLDPVYSGKAWCAVEALAPRGALGRRVLFWHTGGGFGWFGRGAELAPHLDRGQNPWVPRPASAGEG